MQKTDATDYLSNTFLKTEKDGEYLFAHISANKMLKVNSYDKTGVFIDDVDKINEYFIKLKEE